MKSNRLAISLLFILTVASTSCSEDNSPGGKSNNNGGNNNTGGCAGGPTTVTDIDGNVYNVVSIGNQCWMKENLKTTHYKNGAAIPSNLSDAQWQATTSGASADYNNDPTNTAVYGKLYNWYAVADPQGLCPTNWHVPTDAEFDTLFNYLGGDSVCGGAMKEIGTTHWASPNTGATNSSGFTGLPGGYINFLGTYDFIGYRGFWWSATQQSVPVAYTRLLNCDNSSVYRDISGKTTGFSVRCVRD
jgi:uncharacterized protein (TIGR02145 family)